MAMVRLSVGVTRDGLVETVTLVSVSRSYNHSHTYMYLYARICCSFIGVNLGHWLVSVGVYNCSHTCMYLYVGTSRTTLTGGQRCKL